MDELLKPGDEFVSGSYNYEVRRFLVKHPDFDPLLLAFRRPKQGGHPKTVVLRPVPMLYGTETVERVTEEVQVFKTLRHPNIGSVLGAAFHHPTGTPYVVMAYVKGCSLLHALTTAVAVGSRLSPEFGAFVASEVASALEAAHRAETEDQRPLGLVHRAVSPMNIRLGDGGRVRLTNFGAVYTTLPERFPTPPGAMRGDPAYAAPEIFTWYVRERQDGELPPRAFDARADIFSLGLVLLEALTASYPLHPPSDLWRDIQARFPREVRTEHSSMLPLHVLADRVLHFGPEEVLAASKDLPAPLRSILSKALAQDPGARYQSAGMMRGHLLTYLGGLDKPYGEAEADKELSGILKEAMELGHLSAFPGVERGVMRTPGYKATDKDIH